MVCAGRVRADGAHHVGATAVQVVWSSRRGSRQHVGSAHDEAELAGLRVAAVERIAAGQEDQDLGLRAGTGSGPLEIVGSKAGHLWDALCRAYDTLGFDQATGVDETSHAFNLSRGGLRDIRPR